MGIIQRLKSVSDKTIENAYKSYFDNDGFLKNTSFATVTKESAMRVATVYACVRVISEGVASLPLHVYRRTKNGGKEKAVDHHLYKILHSSPNSELTSFDLREFILTSLLLSGNSYCRIYRDRANRVREIIPIQPERVSVDRNKKGDLIFSIDGEKTLNQRSIWRISGLGSDGVIGYTPIELAKKSIQLAIATEQHGEKLFENGVNPSGVLETDMSFKDQDSIDRIRNQLKKGFSGSSAHKPLVLERGLKWRSISMTANEAQFLETRKYQRNEICAIYRVPPHLVGDLDNATYSNIEQQSTDFVVNSLTPWLVRIEQTISRDLISDDEKHTIFAEHNVSGLLRGDISSRSEYYASALRNGWMSRNEVRSKENMNPVAGLDDYLVSKDMGNSSK